MIKPIETRYSGCKFRSRLEARHAVAYDNLGILWEYEKEGFDIDGKWYLPDFWLPKQEWWIEIKGEYPTSEHWDNLQRVAEYTNAKKAFIFWGSIQVPGELDNVEFPATPALLVYPGWDSPYWWCQCPVCGKLGIEYEGRSDRVCPKCCLGDRGYNYDSLELRMAFANAKSYRF